MLGLETDIAAVTDYCIHPADVVKEKTKIGGTKNPDLDAIKALRPDLVIANTDEQRTETLEALEGLGLEVLVTETDSLDDVEETWLQLGRATDKEAAAEEERRRIVTARQGIVQRRSAAAALATLVPVWKNPWMAAGGGTYLGDLLAECGFRNILENIPEKWARIVLSTDAADAQVVEKGPAAGQKVHPLPETPEIVLLPSEPYAFREKDRDAFTAIGVGREQARLVDGEALTWWLSRTADALDAFARLHDELVPHVREA